MLKFAASIALSATILLSSAPAFASGQVIPNDLGKCKAGAGPAVLVNVSGVKESNGKMRVQT